MSSTPIKFREIRDFTRTLNVSSRFIRENFSLLRKCIVYILGPLALVQVIFFKMIPVMQANSLRDYFLQENDWLGPIW